MASILVNGSPTTEFQFHRGVNQGDPLAPYSFILVIESLHLSFSRVIDAGIFTGVRIDHSIMISHLFYTDDVVFICEWSQENLKGVPSHFVNKAADLLGCSVMKTPFKYLIQVAQKKFKKAFENADSSSRVELIPSKIKYAIKVVLSFHKEFSVFSSLSRKENDGLLQRSSVQE
nr:RNA-directed DNA polymerase, eukaryota [Tanacetum cinerariifolium]